MTEKQLQEAVIEAARLLGWRVAHFRPARVVRGGKEIYETPFAADGKGFPDLVLVRPPRLMFIELKSKNGQTSPEQQEWLKALTAVQNAVRVEMLDAYGQESFDPKEDVQIHVNVWRPKDWESGVITRRLK